MYSPIELVAFVGKPTYDRGLAYADRAMVRIDEQDLVGRQGHVSGISVGSQQYPYHVEVDYRLSSNDLISAFNGHCTCPVSHNCKHAVALLITAARQGRATSSEVTPSWERKLDQLFDPIPEGEEPWPLALVLDYSEPTVGVAYSNARRLSRWSTVDARGGLTAGIMRPGKRTPWVSSNVSWSKLRAENFAGIERDHAMALNNLRTLQELGQRYISGGSQIDLAGVDSLLFWQLLDQAVGVGVEILDSETLSPVVIDDEAARAQVFITQDSRSALTITGGILHPALPARHPRVPLGFPPLGVAWKKDGTLHLARIEPRATEAWSRLEGTADGVRIPAGQRKAFEQGPFRRLASLGWTSPDGSFVPEALPSPKLHLNVMLTPSHQPGVAPLAELHWSWRYGDGTALPLRGAERDPLRDAAAEAEILAALPLAPRAGQQLRGMEVVDLTRHTLPRLEEMGVVVSSTELPTFHEVLSPRIRVDVSGEGGPTDWLDLDVTMEVEGQLVPMADLVTALTGGQESLFLPGGIYVSLEDPALDQLRELLLEAASLTDRRRGGIRVPRVRTSWWKDLLDLDVVQIEEDSWLARLRRAAANPTEPPLLPTGLRATLRPYQIAGYQWLAGLRRAGLGGVLADDMGLGKTVQTLAMIADERESGERKGMWLVIAPTSVVANWADEAARFTPDLKVVVIDSTLKRRGSSLAKATKGADVVVTSYTLARLEKDDYAALPVVGMVLDEAQQAKNPASRTFGSLVGIGAPVTYAITGTPMENNLGELWAMFALTAPGLLGSSRMFGEAYRKPIERGTDPTVSAALMRQLQRRIAPFLLRRGKSQVARELPPKQEQILAVDLASAHRRLYDRQLQRERQRVLHLADDFDNHRVEVLSALTRLRQMAIDVSLADEDAVAPSSKLDVLLPLLAEAAVEGHRVLVFSQFTRFLKMIAARLRDFGIDHAYLDGSTTNRRRVIEDFAEGDAPVFLISLKAGGVGLNLTMADYVVLTDPWWNPAVEAQAIDRTHRIGQERSVLVYRLVSRGTIEEKVLALQDTKRRLFEGIVGSGDGQTPTGVSLSADELRDLLG